MNGALDSWKLSGSDAFYARFSYSELVFAWPYLARTNQTLPPKVVHRSINAYFGTQVQGTSCGLSQNNGVCVFPDDQLRQHQEISDIAASK